MVKGKLIKWAKQALYLAIILTLVTVAMDWWRGRHLDKQYLPPLTATSISGQTIDLAELSKDQAVLVYFWGTWCQVCNYVSPAVSSMAENHPTVSVAIRSGEDERLNQYIQHHEYQFNVINDTTGQLGQTWNISVTPTIMVVKDNKIVHYTTGFTSLPGLWWRMVFA
ncbi:protein disulfide oxidoreductase [Motilimonas eburnea]|uniref:protein disulfide oxidoreductase n=1 Tax=Motilimonas eburnea TaxID=1737488 RepID=UPI001E328DE1|nr:protein disulfide oxidoreductase [Motilimonas eburnea]MCE2571093.1 protein disulfide oxidoreductase [Motilimonas eburnea]